jgi:hypothetical protein
MLVAVAAGCSRTPVPTTPGITGLWDAVIVANNAEVPFRFEIVQNGPNAEGFFFEDDRKVSSTSGSFENGTLRLEYDFLNTTLEATVEGNQFQGPYRGSAIQSIGRYTEARVQSLLESLRIASGSPELHAARRRGSDRNMRESRRSHFRAIAAIHVRGAILQECGREGQSLYGSKRSAPAITTMSGRSVCRTSIVAPCAASTSGRRR